MAEAFAELHLTAGLDVIMQVASTFAGTAPGPAEASWLSALVEDLRSILAVTASDAPVSDPDAPLLAVIGQQTRFTDGLLWIACTRGLRVVDQLPDPTGPLVAASMVVVCDEADADVTGRVGVPQLSRRVRSRAALSVRDFGADRLSTDEPRVASLGSRVEIPGQFGVGRDAALRVHGRVTRDLDGLSGAPSRTIMRLWRNHPSKYWLGWRDTTTR